MKILKCIICNKKFKVHNYREKIAKYCSRQCMGKDVNSNWSKTRFKKGHKGFIKKQVVYGKCSFCKKTFKKEKQKNIYCSRDCYWDDLKIRFKKDGHPSKGKPNLKMRGEKHPNWNDGSSGLRRMIDESYKGKEWREKVFERDDYVCQNCSERGGRLEAHHIESFAEIIHRNKIKTVQSALACEELWNIDNGETLCHKCHIKTDNYGYKKEK